MESGKSASLAEKISGILHSEPASFDPEDDPTDATAAKVVQEEVEGDDGEEEILSKFRRENVDLLADLDEKYAGRKTSRKSLRDSDSEDVSDVQTDSSDEEPSEESGNERTEGNVVEPESESSAGPSDDDDTENEQEDSELDEENESFDDQSSEGADENFKHLADTNISSQVKKGLCVRNQMSMWESLLEVRIQLQKCLITSNKMPFPATYTEIKKESGQEFTNKVSETKTKLCDTLDKLLLLQKLVLKQYPETKKLEQSQTEVSKNEDDDDDEEIPSDTEDEKSVTEERTVESEAPRTKRRKLHEYEQEISDRDKMYKKYRNGVIQKWNDKTRVVLKGGATSHSVLDQIEYNLSNKDKLIKRTKLKRSHYSILGEEEKKEEEEYHSEIFDDDDFYHQLLRELIEVKSADVTDPVQLGRQWIQLQSLRSKMKRKIDTRATKGRKIRYAVHSKLVNFMGPFDKNQWTEEAKTELYNSLFGKNQPAFNV